MTLKVAVCQLQEVRESPEAALAWIEEYGQRAESQGAGLVCFPECFLQGYLVTPELARKHAMAVNSSAFELVLQRLAGLDPVLVIGMIESAGESLYNTAIVVRRGRLLGTYRKSNLLPGERLFCTGDSVPVFSVDGVSFGINICSDTQKGQLAMAVAGGGARLLVCPSNNMMRREKAIEWKDRHNETRTQRARETGMWLMSADVTGERGESIGLGPTCIINPAGEIVAQVPLGEVGMVTADIA